jgi:hypothetical protein
MPLGQITTPEALLHNQKIHDVTIFSLNSPCIFIILDIHQQNAQINKGAN